MDYATAVEYYESITVIEAQDNLVRMSIQDYPKMKKHGRSQLYKQMKKLAQPRELQKEISFDAFISEMTGGRGTND